MYSEENSFLTKLNQPNVLAIVNQNKEILEPFGNLVEESLIHFTSHSRTTDTFAEQENDDLQENLDFEENVDSEDENIVDFQINENVPIASATLNPQFSNEEINLMISQLNQKQREIFNVVNTWARQCVQSRSSIDPIKISPLRLFITGCRLSVNMDIDFHRKYI